MPRIIRSPTAGADAREIWAYIATDDLAAADRLLERFDRLFRTISAQPQLGKKVEALAPNLRFVPMGNYLVFYRPLPDGVEIVRLLHGARDITAEFFRE